MRFLLVTTLAALAVALGTAAPAGAATPCWRALINDWFDGQINGTYPDRCYSEALGHLPKDVDYYSSAKRDIEAALAAKHRQHKKVTYDPAHPDSSQSGGGTGGGSGSGGGSGGEPAGGASDSGNKGVITRAIEWLGPSNADAVPLPLLILAGVAFVLLAAAGGSVVSKRLQARRLPPPNG